MERFRSLINGYLREHERNVELNYHIPYEIKELIFLFFPKRCEVYGIGQNEYNELGAIGRLSEFQQLDAFSSLTFDPNNVYFRCYGFVIKTRDNKLFSIGKNSCGDCGVGSNTSKIGSFLPINLRNVTMNEENKSFINCISNGANHLLLCINNSIYGNGLNEHAQLGNQETTAFGMRIPIKIQTNHFLSNNDKIIEIQCGYFHSLFLNDKGQLFACGKNEMCQCGPLIVNNDNDTIMKIINIKCDYIIKKIYVGAKHNLCITKENELVAFGANHKNQCGIYGQPIISQPTLNPYFAEKKGEIQFVSTKHYHSLCIDDQNILYLFGRNHKYQVGKKKHLNEITVFQTMYHSKFGMTKIIQGSTGFDHTILLTKDNDIIGFGGNEYRQSSPSKSARFIKKPYIFNLRQMDIMDGGVSRVMAGEHTTIIIVGF